MQRPLFDAHVHWNASSIEKMNLANRYEAHCLSINTDAPFFPLLSAQENMIHELQSAACGRLHYICSFGLDTWEEDDWQAQTITSLAKSLSTGAVGIKIWKNIGMDPQLRRRSGEFLMLDDPIFDPIYNFAIEHNVVVVGHQGEPLNCWLPLDDMTVDSDRNYFGSHPEFHMHKHPEYPSYKDQIAARDRLLANFPKLKFVGLHLLSLEWSLAEVAHRLDRFPLLMTGLAERICHVQLQARDNWREVRNFFIQYQDRIIYGTDAIDDGTLTGVEFAQRLEKLWNFHWDFFATSNVMHAPEFKGEFTGLNLPEAVLEKIFYSNAVRTYLQ